MRAKKEKCLKCTRSAVIVERSTPNTIAETLTLNLSKITLQLIISIEIIITNHNHAQFCFIRFHSLHITFFVFFIFLFLSNRTLRHELYFGSGRYSNSSH